MIDNPTAADLAFRIVFLFVYALLFAAVAVPLLQLLPIGQGLWVSGPARVALQQVSRFARLAAENVA